MRYAASVVLLLCVGLAGCSSSPEPDAAPASAAKPAPPPVKDHTGLFAEEGRVGVLLVPDHLFDIQALPGGSLGEYDAKGKKYEMFIIDTDSTQNAAFLMLDMKAAMEKEPDYMAHIGGYFGTYRGKPLYCFAKLHYLAGVYGLPRDEADSLAIQLAARLR
jgi:hypothetical protein